MRITDVRITPVAVPRKPSSSESGPPQLLSAILIELDTDDGITGIGESPWQNARSPELLESAGSFLMGNDPRNINLLMREVRSRYSSAVRSCTEPAGIFSGIEAALWDILGKRTGLPLYKVFGGAYRKRIEFAGRIETGNTERMEKAAAAYASEGFRVLSFDACLSEEEDRAAAAAVRRGAPDRKVKLRIDAAGSWSPDEAVRRINALAPYGLECIDRPADMHDPAALKTVRSGVRIPLAGYDERWMTGDVLAAVKADLLDYIHIGGRMAAGYDASRICAGIAEAAGIQCIYHITPGLGIALSMDLHMIAATANCTLAAEGYGYPALEDDVIRGGKLVFSGPYCAVPGSPGIGVSPDPDRIAKYHELYVREVLCGSSPANTEKGGAPA
ncbi:MAG: mandelate racemase/muconate lactonizing enzyme family protein [Lachnospiraceae bacterium]|nr:mandelate racemase/muconate lactonizing enzyme family protein [Lachnospiraceae bacterium]